MSALSRCLLSASQQFAIAANPDILSPRVKALITATVLGLAAVGAVAPSSAHAQHVWGNGTSAQSSDQSALPQSSAGYWGSQLGGLVGRALGGVAGGTNATSQFGRRAQDAVAGIGEEVGRNMGRAVAVKPYQAAAGDKNVQRPVTATPGTYSNPGAYANTSNAAKIASIPQAERDLLDTLALDAIVANGVTVESPPGSLEFAMANTKRMETLRNFELALRSTLSRGFVLESWVDTRLALQQPLRTVSEAQYAKFSNTMFDRLNRAGGPGYHGIQRETRSIDTMKSNNPGNNSNMVPFSGPQG